MLRVLDALPGLSAPASPPFAGPPPPDRPPDDALLETVAALLSPSPVSIDSLARETGAPIGQVLAALTDLSLGGRAELLPGALVIAA